MIGGTKHASPSGTTINRNLVVPCCLIFGVVLLYCIYSCFSWSAPSGGTLRRHHTWKTKNFVPIPADILDKAKSAKIEERRLSFDFNGKKLNLFLREVGASSPKKDNFPILLLHGAGSSSEVWVTTQTLQLLDALGYRAVALDLPGWAKSEESKIARDQIEHFLEQFIRLEKLGKPLLVSPSMSGIYALPFVLQPDPSTCHERVTAYIPLAPVATGKYTPSQYRKCEIPVMTVYGTKDVQLGVTSVANIRNMPNSEIFAMEGAGHANCEERPEEWNKLFYNFLLALESKGH